MMRRDRLSRGRPAAHGALSACSCRRNPRKLLVALLGCVLLLWVWMALHGPSTESSSHAAPIFMVEPDEEAAARLGQPNRLRYSLPAAGMAATTLSGHTKDPLQQCLHTKGLTGWTADSHGNFCLESDISEHSCCAPAPASVSPCEACLESRQCCTSMERCVACCMQSANSVVREEVYEHAVGHPAYRLGLLATSWLGEAGHATAQMWEWRNFTLCSTRCTTGSGSTVHENRYRR